MKNINLETVNKTLFEIEQLPHQSFMGLFKKAEATAMQKIVSNQLRQYRTDSTSLAPQSRQVYSITSINDVKDIMNKIAEARSEQKETPRMKNHST